MEKQNELLINESKSNNFSVKSNKQIEEMAKAILYAGDNYDTCNKDDCETIASLIYNAGYRKASEVVREIFEEMIQLLSMRMGIKEVIAELKKKYIGEDTNVHTNTEGK